MNMFHSQDQKHYSSSSSNISKHHKKRLTLEQVSRLESSFDSNQKLDPQRKLQLARELNIPPRQIAIWYQNKRARWKTQSLELDYNELRLSLEAALADKRRLELDVERLRAELVRAQEVLGGAMVSPPAVSSCCTTDDLHQERWRCGLGGGDDHDDHVMMTTSCSTSTWVNNCGIDHVESMKIEELYACLMGTNESLHYG